jgi:hypothetical protein
MIFHNQHLSDPHKKTTQSYIIQFSRLLELNWKIDRSFFLIPTTIW